MSGICFYFSVRILVCSGFFHDASFQFSRFSFFFCFFSCIFFFFWCVLVMTYSPDSPRAALGFLPRLLWVVCKLNRLIWHLKQLLAAPSSWEGEEWTRPVNAWLSRTFQPQTAVKSLRHVLLVSAWLIGFCGLIFFGLFSFFLFLVRC